MSERLAGKVALVTGGGSGIGEAAVRLFLEEGAKVAFTVHETTRPEDALRAVDPAGERVLVLQADLTKEAEAERVVSETVARFGRLDVLVNNAAVRVWGPITEATPESWDFIIGVNLLSVAYCSKHAAREMIKGGGGAIVNVSSSNAIAGRAGMGQYDATKAAELALTRSMACDHAAQNIRVNAICPGPTLTQYHIRRRAASEGITVAEAEAKMRAAGVGNLLKRWAEPREIAHGILFLACDESSHVTGTSLMVDGGLSV